MRRVRPHPVYTREGEVLVTLDNQERKLTPENLVIADEKGPIALAGVMGGLETEVTESTKNVLLESANFKNADVQGANLHAIEDKNANWNGANTKQVRKTDQDRLEGETWQIPP